jgi:hypothetical protein
MTLDRYGHLLSDDLAGVANVLAQANEVTAVFRGVRQGVIGHK